MRERILAHTPTADRRRFTLEFGRPVKIGRPKSVCVQLALCAREVLAESGQVVVALCDGQGGTSADTKRRHWHDTWQVTEMAAYSDFVLHIIEPFDLASFPHYVNVGYRSCEKSFHCENAIVHVFKTEDPPRILLEDLDKWFSVENMSEDMIFEFLDCHMRNPFSNPQSPTSYICKTLSEKLGFKFNTCEPVESYCNTGSKPSVIDVMKIFSKLKEENINGDCSVVKVVMKTKPVDLKDFSKAPVRCQLMMFGSESISVFYEYLSHLITVFQSGWLLNVVKIEDIAWKSKMLVTPLNSDTFQAFSAVETLVLPNGISCHIIHVDLLAQVLFQLEDWRSLWDGEVDSSSSGKPTFHPKSLFPREHAFDLGLSVPLHLKNQFENRFLLVLWLLAGDMIVKTEHLSTYFPTDRELVCYCYRITYTSHTAPLHRKRVIHIHENIIAKFISKSLRVNIT
ncbi:hypothetical protein J6590_079405 [Homalodisca vitripennis]|nr:hypothetical protein J6590_079405 [Homalodisca vitripennis]